MRSRRPARLAHPLFVLLLLIANSWWLAPSSRAASDAAEEAVAGRLGGPMASFIARVGPATSYITAMGPQYTVEGYGYVTIYVEGYGNEPEEERDPAARVNRINVSSPRPLDRAASQPDPADWSIEEAGERIAELLPADAELAEWSDAAEGQLSATCQSDALTEIYENALTCQIILITPTPETVSYAILTLSNEGEAPAEDEAAEVNPCEGAVEWIKLAGDRLTGIQELIAQVAAVDETDPATVETLREIAQTFRDLAAQQRATDAPDAAAQASYYLIQALTTYAKAIDTAADGVEGQDQTLIDSAVKTLDQASGHVANVTEEIEAAGEACGLELGDAEPAASPAASPAG